MNAIVHALTPEELRTRGVPQAFTVETDAWKKQLRAWWETNPEGPQRPLYPAQPETLLIDLLAYAFSLLGEEAQAAMEQRWLLFSTGGHADLMAANNSTFRLRAAAARCVLGFSIAAPRADDLVLPAGSEAIAPNGLVFTTEIEAEIEAGALTAEAAAVCQTAGKAGNGLSVGAIRTAGGLIDASVSVSNLTETIGGADEESDQALTLRGARAHDRISKAGPNRSYIQQTMAYSPAIIDVGVTRPEPGDTALYILLDSGAPDQPYCDAVKAFLPYDQKRPQGDDLFVYPADSIDLTVTGIAQVKGDAATAKPLIDAAIAGAASAWSLTLGAYVADASLSCAARAVTGFVDIDLIVALSGGAVRQLSDSQFIANVMVDITVESLND